MTAERTNPAERSRLEGELAAHHRAAFAWARHCTRRSREEAEEVLQMSYLKVLEGQARFEGRSSFRTWLFGVIRLTAAEQRRGAFVRDLLSWRVGSDATEAEAEPAPSAEASLAAAQQRTLLERALRALPHRQREVLLLVFYHELAVEEAACVMGVGLGSARQHYARGKERLRHLLGLRGPAP